MQLLIINEEFLVSASHYLVLIASLPFVHTARRLNRLDDSVNDLDREFWLFQLVLVRDFVNQII